MARTLQIFVAMYVIITFLETHDVSTRAHYTIVAACSLHWLIAVLMVVNTWGALPGHSTSPYVHSSTQNDDTVQKCH